MSLHIVINKIKEHVLTTENLARLVHIVNEEMDCLAIEYRQQLDNVIDEITDVNNRLERLYDALETGKIQIADLAPRIQQLRLRAAAITDNTIGIGAGTL